MARGAGASGWGGGAGGSGAKGRREQYSGNEKSLDSELIRRADDFSLFDAGSATKREYDANLKKIKQSNLTEQEKADAVDKLHRLTTEQLKSQTKVANPYVSGVARFNQKQVQKAADSTAQKRQNVNSFMRDVQKKSTANKKAAETKSLSAALGSAMDSGALEVTFGGKTYYRARKTSKTWRIR